MIVEIKQFNCTSASTGVTPLPRPYWCCGWALPPLSFSGKYTCTTTGGSPPSAPFCDVANKSFTLPLVDYCKVGGTLYFYSVPNLPIYAYVQLHLCTLPDGSDGAGSTVGFFIAGAEETINAISCSHIDGKYNVLLDQTSLLNYSGGITSTVNMIVDTVTMP